MATIRSDSYELTDINKDYDKVVQALRNESMIHSSVDGREQFYMPGGKVTLQLRRGMGSDYSGTTFLDVIRTSWTEPNYVKRIIERLGGIWSGSSRRKVRPDKTLDRLLK